MNRLGFISPRATASLHRRGHIMGKRFVSQSPLNRLHRLRGLNPWMDTVSLPYARTAKTLTYTLIGLNTIVFGAWQVAKARFATDQTLYRRMHENFTLSQANMKAGRWWTSITSAFSHHDFGHFLFNMWAMNSFGILLGIMRPQQMIAFITGSALTSSYAWLYQQDSQGIVTKDGHIQHRSSLGASGIACSVVALATCAIPMGPAQFLFIPVAMPLWTLTLGFFAVDTFLLNADTGIGHSAHLGGTFFGFASTLLFLRGRIPWMQNFRRVMS